MEKLVNSMDVHQCLGVPATTSDLTIPNCLLNALHAARIPCRFDQLIWNSRLPSGSTAAPIAVENRPTIFRPAQSSDKDNLNPADAPLNGVLLPPHAPLSEFPVQMFSPVRRSCSSMSWTVGPLGSTPPQADEPSAPISAVPFAVGCSPRIAPLVRDSGVIFRRSELHPATVPPRFDSLS